MKVAIITQEQALLLQGQEYDGQGSLFYPVTDANNNWVITESEINNSIHSEHEWIKLLPLIDFVQPTSPPFPF